MPTATSGGIAGLLQDAGAGSAPAKSTPVSSAPAAAKGMAGILADAQKAPAGGPAAKAPVIKSPAASPFTAPLFGGSKTPAAPGKEFETPGSKILATGNDAIAKSNVGKALTTPTQKKGFFQSIGEQFNSSVDQFDKNVDEWGQTGVLHKADALGKTMLLPVNLLFSPITAGLQASQGIPVIGHLADGLNRLFTAIGAGGGDLATAAVNALPISQESKDAIMPLTQQLGSLAAQLATGKAAGVVTDAFKGVAGEEVAAPPTEAPPEIRTQVVDTAKALGNEITTAMNDPKTHEVMQKVHDGLAAPVKSAPDSIFPKSSALTEVKGKLNSSKATDMHPVLRTELRDALATHGEAATHAALKSELGAGDRQAASHIREAPTPQTAAEEQAAHENALRSAVSEKNLTPDKMPVIQMGAKPKDTLPSVDINEAPKNPIQTPKDRIDALPPEDKAAVMSRTRSNFGKGMDWADAQEEALTNFEKGNSKTPLTIEPIKETIPVSAKTESGQVPREPVQKVAKADEASASKVVEPKVETPAASAEPAPKPLDVDPGTSKVGKSIEAKAIESNLTKGYGDETAKYDATTFKEQARIGKELSDSGTDNLRAVIRGDKPLPEGLKPFGLIAAAEEHAKMHPEQAGEILSELANSKAATQTSEAASGLSLGRMREPDSVTAKLQQIKKSLVEAAGGSAKVAKARATLVKGARAARDAVNLSKEELSWNKFLDQITC